MMISMKVVRNFVKNESNYDIFPLAAIFGTPHMKIFSEFLKHGSNNSLTKRLRVPTSR